MTGPGISVSQGGGEGDSGGVWWHWCHWMEKETKGCGLCCSASLLFLSRLHVHSRAWKGLVVVILKPSPPPPHPSISLPRVAPILVAPGGAPSFMSAAERGPVLNCPLLAPHRAVQSAELQDTQTPTSRLPPSLAQS